MKTAGGTDIRCIGLLGVWCIPNVRGVVLPSSWAGVHVTIKELLPIVIGAVV